MRNAIATGALLFWALGCTDSTGSPTSGVDAGRGGEGGDAPSKETGGGSSGTGGDAGAGSGGSGAPASAAGGTTGAGGTSGADAGKARKFHLATTGTQLVVTGPDLGLQLTAANVAEDADVVSVHQEFYGVPWDAFEANTAPPPEWVAVMDRLADDAAQSKQPVFLSVSMLNGTRESLAAKTTIESL